MQTFLDLLSVLILISAFILTATKRINSYIKAFQLQSFLLFLATFTLGIYNFTTKGFLDIFILSIIIFVLKVIYIPRLLHNTYNRVAYKVEKDFFINIPSSILICAALVILTYYSLYSLDGALNIHIKFNLVNSLSVVLIGLFFMISRKKAIGQIVGFLVLENGMFTTAMLSAQGMPIIVDLGILVDLLTAVMIMGMLVFKINESFDSINIERLRNLRG
ncbi:MAG: hydrogenase [Firmicutes bacterium HGW-Firmicutes-12]|jgi:hydrogenase-4 component E|nr:MAG: hydrogenase [Firmicutes bacterium HGW-Firmicutes-12]